MENNQNKIRKAEQRNHLPEIDLLPVISHNKENLNIAVFGYDNYKRNIADMQEKYFHSAQLPSISFRPANTTESISAAHYNFKNIAKLEIFDPRWLQVGYIVKTQDGVFTNTIETNETNLKQLLNGAEKINGIYLIDNQIGFAPHSSFKRGVQDADTFARGGLARVLEHTPEKVATKLKEIASPEFYKNGVDVWGFDTPEKLILKVASLSSDGGRLGVNGYWHGDDGYAFGVLDKSRSDATKN